jgi:hypothetical protein
MKGSAIKAQVYNFRIRKNATQRFEQLEAALPIGGRLRIFE